jgi:endonuclease YncB( thermonuclease family)
MNRPTPGSEKPGNLANQLNIKVRHRGRLLSTVFSARFILLAILAGSVYQYVEKGEVSWLTTTFRAIESTGKRLAENPERVIDDVTTSIRNYVEETDIVAAGPYDLVGRVVKVADGDSIRVVDSSRKEHEIRLHGIDSPERGQPYANAARKVLSGLVAGNDVAIEERDIDQYGRIVGVVYLGDININLAMVESGHAWWYEHYARFDRDLEAAQARARESRLGLWRDSNPTPPWEWRRRSR